MTVIAKIFQTNVRDEASSPVLKTKVEETYQMSKLKFLQMKLFGRELKKVLLVDYQFIVLSYLYTGQQHMLKETL